MAIVVRWPLMEVNSKLSINKDERGLSDERREQNCTWKPSKPTWLSILPTKQKQKECAIDPKFVMTDWNNYNASVSAHLALVTRMQSIQNPPFSLPRGNLRYPETMEIASLTSWGNFILKFICHFVLDAAIQRQKDRQTDRRAYGRKARQTDRQMDIATEGKTDRQTDGHNDGGKDRQTDRRT